MGKKHIRCLSAVLAVIFLLLQGCSSAALDPPTREIAERSSAAGYLAALVEQSGGFISSDSQTEQAYLYDNAIALYAPAEAGAAGHAAVLADAIVYAQQNDRTFHDGRLRNVYLRGDPSADSGRSMGVAGGAVPLPGFWQNGKWMEDYFAVSTSAGNAAWTMLALCKTAGIVSAEKRAAYIAAAEDAASFLLGLNTESGGFTAGYEGWDETQEKVKYKSTEQNLALTAAFTALSALVRETSPQKAAEYDRAAASAQAFVRSMYDADKCCFYTGTLEDGVTVSKGVVPLDANALALLGTASEDIQGVLDYVKKSMAVGAGFDFSAGDLDGVWNQGTAMMALCYLTQDMETEYSAVMGYLKTQEYKDGSIPAADRDGVSTGFVLSGTDTLWEYDNELSIGATGWYALAQLKANPLD